MWYNVYTSSLYFKSSLNYLPYSVQHEYQISCYAVLLVTNRLLTLGQVWLNASVQSSQAPRAPLKFQQCQIAAEFAG